MNILCKEFSERYGITNHSQQDVRGFTDKLRSENNGVMYYAEKGGDGSLNFVVWW